MLALFLALCAAGDDPCIVREGQPRARIVVAAQSPRTTRLAAQELQACIRKISGATLPIATDPGDDLPVRIYVGRSPHTDRLKIPFEDLKYGAYRIVSGKDWLALVGDDTDFTPIEPWPRSHNDWTSGRVHAEWDRITGAAWGNPMSQLRKHYTGRTSTFGKPGHPAEDKDGAVHVWGFDERGSFNAVCEFLRGLGARWYLPGELGEVLPSQATIPLPEIDRIVRPDFAVRRVNFRFGIGERDTALWAMRLGLRDPSGLQIAHGMHTLVDRPEIRGKHPDWFALYGGRRDNDPARGNVLQLCYSNPELFQETIRYVRALFDHYKFDAVSVMPPDGYTAICQCPACEGKDTPERGDRGRLSDYVWDFVNRVAREIARTHPDRKVTNCAYGAYTLPPLKIEKIEPNVTVCIVGGRRPTRSRPEQQEEVRKLRESWIAKTDNPIMIFENYPFTDRGWYLPAYVPHVIGAGVNATKGASMGEDVWLTIGQDFHREAIGFNHFMVYFTARMYWGGPEQDVEALFDEYCRLFYGPAGEAMKAFFEYCETNWQNMEKDKAKADAALDLFAAAKGKAAPGSVHARRLALVDAYLEGLRHKAAQLGRKRGPVPQLRLVWDAEDIVVDGRLDEPAWEKCPSCATGRLREIQTGREPTFGTSFKAAWGRGGLYFAIRCEDRPGEKPNISATKRDDPAIWRGDAVEILLETESHSYYQVAVNPAGALADLDRGADKGSWSGWDSQAEAAARIEDGRWTVEIRIPVTRDDSDPLHQVVGRKPTASLPWYFNVCRQRVRDTGAEYSAFSPTGKGTFHEPMKFAHFFDGHHTEFEADPSVKDFLTDLRAAVAVGKGPEAAAAWEALAAGEGLTDFQKSHALEEAAACARQLRDFARAGELAGRIPIEAAAKTARMENLLAERKAKELIGEFQGEDLSRWPFWKAGEAFYARGRAYAATGAGKEAEADLAAALELISDSLTRLAILRAIGGNREENLKDEDGALEAYRRVVESPKHRGNAEYYHGVLDAARVLGRKGRHDEALAVLGGVKIDGLRGYWHGAMLLAQGRALAATGRRDEAAEAWRKLLADEGAHPAHRKEAREALEGPPSTPDPRPR